MISIRHISLHLPTGMEGRATNIANMVADSLAKINITKSINRKKLSVHGVNVDLAMTDQAIADVIHVNISKKLGEEN